MEKEIAHNGQTFTAAFDEVERLIEIESAQSGISGYVGPASGEEKLDHRRIFTYSLTDEDYAVHHEGMTLEEAVHRCCAAIIGEETRRELNEQAVAEMEKWLNNQPGPA